MTGDSRLTIAVAARVAATPEQAGWTWAVLQYLLGFARLGHDVWFLDVLEPEAVRPAGAALADSDNAASFLRTMREFGIGQAALLDASGGDPVGRPPAEVRDALDRTDILFNISGRLQEDDLLARPARRVYLDVDPGFTQLWQQAQGIDMGLAGHTDFATVGTRIGGPGCRVPTLGVTWVPTLPPVVLERWPAARPAPGGALTSVANWRGYGSIEHEGVFYGQKVHALRRFLDLPSRSGEWFQIALAIDSGETRDLEALGRGGWDLVDPARACGTPRDYQAFIRRSKAEFGIAKSGYVEAGCGWFSDRSACYLATGRPVLAHDTGFGAALPPGPGLLPFRTPEDALAAIGAINDDYDRHARGARMLAEAHLDSDLVLGRLLTRLGA